MTLTALPAPAFEKARLFLSNEGVDDALQPLQRLGLAEHGAAQHLAVRRTVTLAARKGAGDGAYGAAATGLQRMHGGIGVEDGHAQAAEGIGGG